MEQTWNRALSKAQEWSMPEPETYRNQVREARLNPNPLQAGCSGVSQTQDAVEHA